MDLLELAEMEHEDPDMVPDIVPVDARLSVKAPVEKLRALFSRAAVVVPTKEVIPGTSYALLEAVSGSKGEAAHLRITATDGTRIVSLVADGVSVLMEGRVLLPARRMHDILKLASDSTIKLDVVGAVASVRSGRALWSVQTPVGEALPVSLDVSGIRTRAVSVGPFVSALSAALLAADEHSAWLGLRQLSVESGQITGSDGGRIHRGRILVDGVENMSFTMPVNVAIEVQRMLKATSDGAFELGYSDKHLVFRIDSDFIVAQRIQLPFPDMENLLLGPAFTNTNTFLTNRTDLLNTIRRVRVNADPDTAALHLSLVPGKKDADGNAVWSLAVRAKDRLGNVAQEILEATWTGSAKPRPLVVNHHFLTDLLTAIPTEDAFIRIGDGTKTQPSALYVEDLENGFIGVVQQMLSTW